MLFNDKYERIFVSHCYKKNLFFIWRSSVTFQKNAICNEACHCNEGRFEPVCGDSLTYISPCHAGCRQSNLYNEVRKVIVCWSHVARHVVVVGSKILALECYTVNSRVNKVYWLIDWLAAAVSLDTQRLSLKAKSVAWWDKQRPRGILFKGAICSYSIPHFHWSLYLLAAFITKNCKQI